MMFSKDVVFRETDNKRLIFNRNQCNKFIVSQRVIWDDTYYKWETVATFGTQGEANTYYENMADLPAHRNFNEWMEMMFDERVCK